LFEAEIKALEERLNNESEENACLICFDTPEAGEMFLLEDCAHIFHADCMKKHMEMQINDNRIPIGCPA
jgi:hypothetical protein